MKRENKNHEHHEFAFYYPLMIQELTASKSSTYQLSDKQLCHRIGGILRLHEGESFVVFDEEQHCLCTIINVGKSIKLSCGNIEKNQAPEPHITFCLPLLKREAFEEAIYSLTELGANIIQPIVTHKAQRAWQGEKEHERLHRIMQAAAEQSKNFAFPKLSEPIQFEELPTIIAHHNYQSIFFDPEGTSLLEALSSINQKEKLMLMVGPEGDLTDEEKELLRKAKFNFCSLTPTVLRAQQAVVVALGMVRTYLKA